MNLTIMTIEQLFNLVLRYRISVYISLVVVPVIVFALSLIHGVYDGRESPWRHLYSMVVHLGTALFSALGALFVYHILDRGSSAITTDALVLVGAFFLGWLFLLAVVKRAVDFSMIRSVRNPLVLLFSWILGWGAAAVLDMFGLLIIPGPRPVLLAAVAVVAFLFVRIFLSLIARMRS